MVSRTARIMVALSMSAATSVVGCLRPNVLLGPQHWHRMKGSLWRVPDCIPVAEYGVVLRVRMESLKACQ